MTVHVATAAEFPHGLKCANCGQDIDEGTPYTGAPEGLVGDEPVDLLVCLGCAEDPMRDAALVAWLMDEPPCDPDWPVRPVTDLPDISDWEDR